MDPCAAKGFTAPLILAVHCRKRTAVQGSNAAQASIVPALQQRPRRTAHGLGIRHNVNQMLRYLFFLPELLLYGPSYGLLQYLIRSPRPLDPQSTWDLITREPPPPLNWFRKAYPPPFMRGLALAAKIRQDHLVGISKHYDVSNEFYQLFLDKKYMFYTSGDFAREDESLEDAQTRKADRIVAMLDPRGAEDTRPWLRMGRNAQTHL